MTRIEKPRSWIGRESRIPLYVPVMTDPRLFECFAVNLSPSGIGLMARRGMADPLPAEGAAMALELTLPDASAPLSNRAEVQWCVDTAPAVDERVAVAIGLRFGPLSGAARAELVRFFDAYRPHVAVVGADPTERDLLRQALAPHVHLHEADDEAALDELRLRGDISAVIVCGRTAGPAVATVARLCGKHQEEAAFSPALARDLSPRVIYAAPSAPALLVELFNRGQLFAVIPQPLMPEVAETTVLRACGDFGVRTEQHRVTLALERALLRERARERVGARLDVARRDYLVVESPAMRSVVEAARAVAPHKVGVLLSGETGTGKEVVARLIHELSGRADAAFLVQDCGALTETLLDSELFGHVKGAFTGAVAAHPGLFVLADGGTILLDEIENMSPALQAKLLRVIETGEVRPVGGARVRQVDVRVIAASNRDLATEVAASRLRADLYYRLATFPMMLPPLRARREDLLPLAEHFRLRAEAALGQATAGLSKGSRRRLLAHDWPGNVRELRNVIDRGVLLTKPGRPVEVEVKPTAWLPQSLSPQSATSLNDRVAAMERELIREALDRHHGVVRRAAKELGMNAVTLGRKVKEHELDQGRRK
jgi:two-component system, NtrC family, response regulator HupR/HoxA